MVASTGFDLPLIVDDAVQLAGGLSMTAQDVQNARTSLTLLLNQWSNRGYNTWRIVRDVPFTLLEANSSVALTRTPVIDDVLVAQVLVSTGTRTTLTRRSADEFARITTPGSTGLPTVYYLQRTDTPVLHVYPIGRPDQDESLLLTVVERPAAFDRLDADVDAPGRWLNAVLYGVALGVAKRRTPLDPERVAMLERDAAMAESDALGADRARVPWRMRI